MPIKHEVRIWFIPAFVAGSTQIIIANKAEIKNHQHKPRKKKILAFGCGRAKLRKQEVQ
jgi:hypothetical protein